MTKNFTDDIDRATRYCTYCPKMCRFSCPAAEAENRETVTPWGMMRLLELVKDGSVEPTEDVAETFYHCMGCRRCQTWCAHDNDVPEAMFEARNWMRELGHVPEQLRDFPEEFLEYNSPHGQPGPIPQTHGYKVEEVFDDESTVVYMPDCETRYHSPSSVVRAGLLLEIFHGTKVRLYTRREDVGFACCGFPLLAAGQGDAYEGYRAGLESALADADTVVTDCAASVALFEESSSFGRDSDINIVHLIEFLAERIDFVEPREKIELDGAMLHDSCFVGRQLELYEETRQLLRALCADPPAEFQFNRDEAPCCGGPSHYHVVAPEASERCAEERIEQMEREGGQQLLCGSTTCVKAFRRAGSDDIATDVLDIACRAFGL
jgi:Fe-S oxidoreductase